MTIMTILAQMSKVVPAKGLKLLSAGKISHESYALTKNNTSDSFSQLLIKINKL